MSWPKVGDKMKGVVCGHFRWSTKDKICHWSLQDLDSGLIAEMAMPLGEEIPVGRVMNVIVERVDDVGRFFLGLPAVGFGGEELPFSIAYGQGKCGTTHNDDIELRRPIECLREALDRLAEVVNSPSDARARGRLSNSLWGLCHEDELRVLAVARSLRRRP